MNLSKYNSIIFDCDGVILNSNKVKTRAFKVATKSYGDQYSNELVSYHLLNGGISRYEKFNYFLDSIVKIKSKPKKKLLRNELLSLYKNETEKGLLSAEVTYGLDILRDQTHDITWSIVSGGDQKELNYIFKEKGINLLFDGGIYGSPDTKDQIIKREIKNGRIRFPCLLLGDSKLDHEVASLNSIDFIFISEWSDFKLYRNYCKDNSIRIISKVFDLID